VRPDAEEILRLVLARLDDMKAEDTVTIDLTGKSTIADTMVVTSGRSNRHVGSVADRVLEDLAKAGVPRESRRHAALRLGADRCGDVIVHVFRPEARAFYKLRRWWAPGLGRMDAGKLRASVGSRQGDGLSGFPFPCVRHACGSWVAVVGRLIKEPERELRGALSQRAPMPVGSAGLSAFDSVDDQGEAAPAMPPGQCSKNRSPIANVIPDRAVTVIPRMSAARARAAPLFAGRLQGWRAQDAPRSCSSSARADGLAPSLRDKATSPSPSARRPGRTSSCGSCCWSSSTAPSPSSPGIPITARDRRPATRVMHDVSACPSGRSS
jgi:ribosome-associated protein